MSHQPRSLPIRPRLKLNTSTHGIAFSLCSHRDNGVIVSTLSEASWLLKTKILSKPHRTKFPCKKISSKFVGLGTGQGRSALIGRSAANTHGAAALDCPAHPGAVPSLCPYLLPVLCPGLPLSSVPSSKRISDNSSALDFVQLIRCSDSKNSARLVT